MGSDSHKDPREKIVHLLGDDKHKNPYRQMGVQKKGLIPCYENKNHSFHPKDEMCPDCQSWVELQKERKAKEEKARAEAAAKAAKLMEDLQPEQKEMISQIQDVLKGFFITPPIQIIGTLPPSIGEKLYAYTVRMSMGAQAKKWSELDLMAKLNWEASARRRIIMYADLCAQLWNH